MLKFSGIHPSFHLHNIPCATGCHITLLLNGWKNIPFFRFLTQFFSNVSHAVPKEVNIGFYQSKAPCSKRFHAYQSLLVYVFASLKQ